MAEEIDYHPMWKDLGMDVEAHDGLLAAVGGMYQDVFLTQENRPKSTEYLDNVVMNIHSGRIKEMVDHKASDGQKVVGSFCLYVPEEIVRAANGIPVGLCSGADWATDKVEEHLPRNTCPLIKSFTGFKLGKVCPYIESSDLVVGENTCDGKKKAYEYFGTQKPMHIMDVPNVKNDGTMANWKAEIRRLAERVEQETGTKITAESLKEAIRVTNDKRRALQRLSATRAADQCQSAVATASLPSRLRSWTTPSVLRVPSTPWQTSASSAYVTASASHRRARSASSTPARPWQCRSGSSSRSSRRQVPS